MRLYPILDFGLAILDCLVTKLQLDHSSEEAPASFA
jgi:hypothetical protein